MLAALDEVRIAHVRISRCGDCNEFAEPTVGQIGRVEAEPHQSHAQPSAQTGVQRQWSFSIYMRVTKVRDP